MKKKEIEKTLPTHYRGRSWRSKVTILCRYGEGLLHKLIGKEPPFPCTPNFAADKWISWLRRNSLPAVKGHVIIVALKNQSWMDWAMYAACWMRRLGLAPIILFSEKDVFDVYGRPKKMTLKQKILTAGFWDHAEQIPDVMTINVDAMSEASPVQYPYFGEEILELAYTNAAYELSVEEREKGELRAEYEKLVQETSEQLLKETCQAYELLLKLNSTYSPVRLIGYSGLIGRSSCYECAAKKIGMNRTWVESWGIRPGLMRWNFNKPALDFNVQEWIENLAWDQVEQDEADRFLSFQESGKTSAVDNKKMENHLNYQISSKDDKLPDGLKAFLSKDSGPVFLLATNVVGDSATLQRQTIFESQREWIVQVVRYFASNPDKRLIIRAHPSERYYALFNLLNVNLGSIAAAASQGVENVYVVQWQDPVNTYSLIPYIRAGLTWVSNTGVDLVVRGVPVLSAARPVYEKLGITEEPSSKDEYFKWIETLSSRQSETTKTQKETGLKYLYVIYKKIGMLGMGPRSDAFDLMLDHSVSSEYGSFYKSISGLQTPKQ
jgi:hypothetical protein